MCDLLELDRGRLRVAGLLRVLRLFVWASARRGRFGVGIGDDQLAADDIDLDDGTVPDVSTQGRPADEGLDLARDETAQRASHVERVVALLGDVPAGVVRHSDTDAPGGEAGTWLAQQ